jgi:hypothetical protein
MGNWKFGKSSGKMTDITAQETRRIENPLINKKIQEQQPLQHQTVDISREISVIFIFFLPFRRDTQWKNSKAPISAKNRAFDLIFFSNERS